MMGWHKWLLDKKSSRIIKDNISNLVLRLENLADIVRVSCGHSKVSCLSPLWQKGRHFGRRYFRWIFVNEKFCILVKISMKFVSKDQVNKPLLVHIMTWRRIGDKPLSQPMLTRFTDAYLRHTRGDELSRDMYSKNGKMNAFTNTLWVTLYQYFILFVYIFPFSY